MEIHIWRLKNNRKKCKWGNVGFVMKNTSTCDQILEIKYKLYKIKIWHTCLYSAFLVFNIFSK
jgi:hypothetical protein